MALTVKHAGNGFNLLVVRHRDIRTEFNGGTGLNGRGYVGRAVDDNRLARACHPGR